MLKTKKLSGTTMISFFLYLKVSSYSQYTETLGRKQKKESWLFTTIFSFLVSTIIDVSNEATERLIKSRFIVIEKHLIFLYKSYQRSCYSTYILKIHQSKINSSWVAGPIEQTNRRPSICYSKQTFYRLRALKTLYFYFCIF